MKGTIITETKYVRFLNERQAAEYAGMTMIEFRRECTVVPLERAQKRKVWDVYALDRWLDGPQEKGKNTPLQQGIDGL